MVAKGASEADDRGPVRCRVDARSPAAGAARVAGRSIGVRRRSLRGPVRVLRAADEGLEAADDHSKGCELAA